MLVNRPSQTDNSSDATLVEVLSSASDSGVPLLGVRRRKSSAIVH